MAEKFYIDPTYKKRWAEIAAAKTETVNYPGPRARIAFREAEKAAKISASTKSCYAAEQELALAKRWFRIGMLADKAATKPGRLSAADMARREASGYAQSALLDASGLFKHQCSTNLGTARRAARKTKKRRK